MMETTPAERDASRTAHVALAADLRALVGGDELVSQRAVNPDEYTRRTGDRVPSYLAFYQGAADLAAVIRALLDRYAEAKTEARVIDFDDLLRLTLRVMERDAQAAAAQRWRFRHLFVDEFQDVNPLQYRLLRAWLGDGDDLFVVGDPHQAIYGWNGADARYLDRFEEAFPVDRFPGVAVLHLRDNYRPTRQLQARPAHSAATPAGGDRSLSRRCMTATPWKRSPVKATS